MHRKMIRNHYLRLFQLELYSPKTIRLFALDFYEAVFDSAFGLINYHLIGSS